jgi:hypothetical protein
MGGMSLHAEAKGTFPRWLCPTCFSQGKKAFLQPTGATVARGLVHNCQGLLPPINRREVCILAGCKHLRVSLLSQYHKKIRAGNKADRPGDHHKRFLDMAREGEASDDPREFEQAINKNGKHEPSSEKSKTNDRT